MKKALLFEVNTYHQVLIPGLIYYLRKLDFIPELLVREGLDCRDVLDCYDNMVQVYRYNDENVESVISGMGGLKSYAFIFFASFEYYHDGVYESAYDYLNNIDSAIESFAGIIHNPDVVDKINARWIANKGNMFTLNEICKNSIHYDMCMPMYFGEYKKELQNTKQIFLVGQSNDINYVARQIQEVFDSGYSGDFSVVCVGEFDKKKIIIKYFLKVLVDFMLKLAGRNVKYDLGYSVRALNKIKFVGKISYKKMFKLIEDSAFIDIAIDPDVENQFYKGRTTGALLLSYGFAKPCIMENRYAEAYGISGDASIVYGKNEYGMVRGLMLDDDEYRSMVRNFEKKIAMVKNDSVMNMKRVL